MTYLRRSLSAMLFVLLTLGTPKLVAGAYHGPPGFSPYFGDDGDGFFGPGRGGAGAASGFGPPGIFGPGFDIERAERMRLAHGVVLAIAFVGVLPIGAILVRIPFLGRFGVWIHAACQMLGWALGAVGLGLGAWMVANIKPFGRSLFSISDVAYHPIIGIVVLSLLLLPQPILGLLHHRNFRRLGRRTAASHMHLWNGRSLIVLGIVNGGLGLHVAGASRAGKIAYGVLAGIMGLVWFLAACFGEVRRARHRDRSDDAAHGGESARIVKGNDGGGSGGSGRKERSMVERYS